MLEQYFRNSLQSMFINPLSRKLTRYLSANYITYLAGITGVLVLPLLVLNKIYFAIIFLLLSGLFDMLDGTVARITQTTSAWGTVLDIMVDRLVEVTIVIGLCLMDPGHRAIWGMIMLASIVLCITSFLIVGVFTTNQSYKSFHYSPGIMERAEAFIFFIAMILLPSAFTLLAGIFSILVLLTTIIRLYQFKHQCSSVKP